MPDLALIVKIRLPKRQVWDQISAYFRKKVKFSFFINKIAILLFFTQKAAFSKKLHLFIRQIITNTPKNVLTVVFSASTVRPPPWKMEIYRVKKYHVVRIAKGMPDHRKRYKWSLFAIIFQNQGVWSELCPYLKRPVSAIRNIFGSRFWKNTVF